MAYIYHNKINDRYLAFSNMKAISINTGIGYENLVRVFTREGKTQYITKDESIIITKVDLIKTYKKTNK